MKKRKTTDWSNKPTNWHKKTLFPRTREFIAAYSFLEGPDYTQMIGNYWNNFTINVTLYL